MNLTLKNILKKTLYGGGVCLAVVISYMSTSCDCTNKVYMGPDIPNRIFDIPRINLAGQSLMVTLNSGTGLTVAINKDSDAIKGSIADTNVTTATVVNWIVTPGIQSTKAGGGFVGSLGCVMWYTPGIDSINYVIIDMTATTLAELSSKNIITSLAGVISLATNSNNDIVAAWNMSAGGSLMSLFARLNSDNTFENPLPSFDERHFTSLPYSFLNSLVALDDAGNVYLAQGATANATEGSYLSGIALGVLSKSNGVLSTTLYTDSTNYAAGFAPVTLKYVKDLNTTDPQTGIYLIVSDHLATESSQYTVGNNTPPNEYLMFKGGNLETPPNTKSVLNLVKLSGTSSLTITSITTAVVENSAVVTADIGYVVPAAPNSSTAAQSNGVYYSHINTTDKDTDISNISKITSSTSSNVNIDSFNFAINTTPKDNNITTNLIDVGTSSSFVAYLLKGSLILEVRDNTGRIVLTKKLTDETPLQTQVAITDTGIVVAFWVDSSGNIQSYTKNVATATGAPTIKKALNRFSNVKFQKGL